MAQRTSTANLEAALKSAVAERVGSSRFDLWFGEGVHLDIQGDSLVVGVPNSYFRDRIRGHYAAELAGAAEAVAGRPMGLAFRVDAEAEPPLGNVVAPEPAHRGRPEPTVPLPPPVADRPRAGRPPRRLEDFIAGPGNRLAHAAAVEVVQSAGASFSPLVVHGGVGLGKTHLLEGVVHGMRSRRPGLKIIHLTAEAFTNGFLDAMRGGTLGAFRARHRKAEALVLDDAHFLAGTRATQNEFLHTFNALVQDGAPIVLSADQHPRLIAKLADELVTRFLGGMVVKLEAPDPATRLAILKAKARSRGVDVPEAVLAYVAEHIRSSVRELEGALNSLIAHALLTGRRIDMTLARSALRDTIRHTAQAVAMKDIERAVCELFGVKADDLRSNGRARALSQPRMLAMHLARKLTGASYSEIGRHFGGRNHSTVISAEKKVQSWLQQEERNKLLAGFESIADVLAALERSLGA